MLGCSHHWKLPNLTFCVAPWLWPRVRSDMNNIEIWGARGWSSLWEPFLTSTVLSGVSSLQLSYHLVPHRHFGLNFAFRCRRWSSIWEPFLTSTVLSGVSWLQLSYHLVPHRHLGSGIWVQEFILPMGIFSYASANLPPSGKKTSISAYLWLCETDTMAQIQNLIADVDVVPSDKLEREDPR